MAAAAAAVWLSEQCVAQKCFELCSSLAKCSVVTLFRDLVLVICWVPPVGRAWRPLTVPYLLFSTRNVFMRIGTLAWSPDRPSHCKSSRSGSPWIFLLSHKAQKHSYSYSHFPSRCCTSMLSPGSSLMNPVSSLPAKSVAWTLLTSYTTAEDVLIVPAWYQVLPTTWWKSFKAKQSWVGAGGKAPWVQSILCSPEPMFSSPS